MWLDIQNCVLLKCGDQLIIETMRKSLILSMKSNISLVYNKYISIILIHLNTYKAYSKN